VKKNFLLAAAFVCLLWSPQTFAQTTNATIGGTVSDATGALIPGVTVTATNTQTGIVTTGVTNESGSYQLAAVQTGRYNVRAELPGFQPQIRTDVVLGVSQQVRLNFRLEVSAIATAVEVTAATDTLIATTSSSVGSVLPEYKIRDLPLPTREVLDLVGTTAGTSGGSYFAGQRQTAVNVTRDGVPTTEGRYTMGISTSTYVSSDLVEEVRVIVAPVDAETGRGSGQVQMATRSGTNEFHGSVFWQNRNSALSANSWINNFNGVDKDYRNANQLGGRLGGPVIRNKTFFFFLFEGQRFVTKGQFTGNVLTEEARRGNFRFFPGVQNGNILSNNPVVDVFGNPITPQNAQGPLETVSVFNRDPRRPGMDRSGWVQQLVSRMPLPNDFTVGDGLNTAGHRWLRRIEGEDTSVGDGRDTNRDQYNVRLDHNFNSSHKATYTGTFEDNWSMSSQTGIAHWPGGYDGTVLRRPQFHSAALVSTLSSTVVNEFRVGYRKNWHYAHGAAFREDAVGQEVRSLLPNMNGQMFFPSHNLFSENFIPNLGGNGTRGQTSHLYTFTDSLSWTKGTHAFKTGVDFRLNYSFGFTGIDNPDFYMPSVNIGAGSTPVRGISDIPGLIGSNVDTAEDLLLNLAGSVSDVSMTYNIRHPTDSAFKPETRLRDFRQKELGVFFKDDWKIRRNVTLNLGVRYDYYSVPYEKFGAMTNTVGGQAGLFGISGTSFADMWQPGKLNGSLTMVEFVGKHSPNPDKQIWADDWNNFAPAVGFSWSLPWWGQDKTVLRGGYGMNYQGTIPFGTHFNLFVGGVPGSSAPQNLTRMGLGAEFFNLTNLPLPLPPPDEKPLSIWGLDQRSSSMNGFDDNRVNPYIQNWTLEIQRELASNLTFEARYVGTKGTKLLGRIPLNTVNIFENGILDAFEITRSGGDAPLFDRMLMGLNLGSGVINGNTVTGSASLRANSLFRNHIADGNVGQFADLLNRSSTVTARAGGLLLNSGLFPQNFIVVNPQFANVTIEGNTSNSTYHSMQLQLTKRLSGGFTNQTSYTWSRALGDFSDDGQFAATATSNHWFNPRDRSLNKALLTFHRTHDIRSNGTFELPFGPNRPLLNNAPRLLSRLVEQWQLGGIFGWTSGAPLNITAPISTITQANLNMPVIVGDFPKSTGKVTRVAVGATYFPEFTQIADPGSSNVTTAQGLRNRFSNRALADAQGNPILVNPQPGKVGTLGQRWIEGPGHIQLDVNIIKRLRIDESKNFEIRADVINLLNTPYWADPETNINSLNFGRMTAASEVGGNSAREARNGTRSFTLTARLNF
jgi:hypothetical protein